MPGIVVFNRRWGVGSDDLVIPATVTSVLHTVWIIILGAVLGLADFDPDVNVLSGCGTALRNLIIGFLATMCCSAALELAAAGVSMRGTILNPQPRAAMSYLLYTRLAVLLVEFVWQVLGVIWLIHYYSSCTGVGAKRALLGVIVSNGIVTICILLSVWCTFDSAGRSWVKMKRYQESLKGREPRAHQKRCSGSTRRNWRHRKAMRKYEQSWDRRCRFLFCCIKEDRHRNSFAEIAKLFTEFFRDLDVVPSDVVAGLVLLRKHQQLNRKFVISQGSNDIYEYLSGVPITPLTPFVDVTQNDVMVEYEKIVHYMRYALAAYGWPIYIMMNTGMGLCRIMPSLRCCCCFRCCSGSKTTWRTLLVDDNCCRCNFAALQQLTGLKHMDIVYATYHVDIGETPFYIAVDHDKRTVVISIRGTLSLQDVLTDLKADAEILPVEPMKEDWLAHKGMVQAAAYIYKKIKEENLLAAAFNMNTDKESGDYDVVVVGHSLGAGTAAILAILMRQEYPTLQCYSYSPPGGLLSAKCVEDTKSFITSVVVGKDVVPRIGLHQLEAFRQDLINVIKKSTEPKWKIIGSSVVCCSCRGDEDDNNSMATVTVEMSELMRQDKEARSFIHPGDAQISLSAHTPLFLPGKILHVVRSHERFRSSILPCGGDEPLYQALWANNADFDQVLISPTMANDHMPDKVLEALERVLTDYALIQRRSPDVATTTSIATDVRLPPQPSSAAQYACLIDIDTELTCSNASPDVASSAAIACKPSELILLPDTSITCTAEHTTVVRSPSGCYIEPRYPLLMAKLEQLPLPVPGDTVVTSLEGLERGSSQYRYSVDPPSPVGYPDETPAPEVTPISATEPKKFLWSDTNSAQQAPPCVYGDSHAQNGDIRPPDVDTNQDLIVVNGDATLSDNSASAFLVNGDRVENSRSLFGNSRQCSDSDDQQQYLYDAFFGHYSPAGRGYPHGLHECTDCRFFPAATTELKASDVGPIGTCGLVNGGTPDCGHFENGVNGTGSPLTNNHNVLILSDDNEDSKFNDAS